MIDVSKERLLLAVRNLRILLENERKEKRELEEKVERNDGLLRKAGEKLALWQFTAECQHDDIIALEKTLEQLDARLSDDEDIPAVGALIEENYPKRVLH